jgi:hypothetical protein
MPKLRFSIPETEKPMKFLGFRAEKKPFFDYAGNFLTRPAAFSR